MTAALYPEATWLGNGRTGGSYRGGPWKVVLHTTETENVPGYSSGKSAPHLTYVPATGEWFQHTSLLVAARSLRNGPDPVQTNRDSAIQLEIVCYSNAGLAEQSPNRLWVGDLNARQLDEIKRFLKWTNVEFGVELKWPGRAALSYAEANAPGFRFSISQWDNWGGVCAHQHVPDSNQHWDTGALDWGYLFDESAPVPPSAEMMLKRGDTGGGVRRFQESLIVWELAALPLYGADGDFGAETEEWVKKFQQVHGLINSGHIDGLTGSLLSSFSMANIPSKPLSAIITFNS